MKNERLADYDSEAGALACVLTEDKDPGSKLRQMEESDFDDLRHVESYRALLFLEEDGEPLNVVSLARFLFEQGKMDAAGGRDYIAALPDATPSPANFPTYLAAIKDRAARRAIVAKAEAEIEAARNLAQPVVCESVTSRLADRRFNSRSKPPEPLPRFLVMGKGVSTPGNLTTISGPAKTAKSAVVEAMISAAITTGEDRDTLGVTAPNPDGRALIHFDTEQSLYDHHSLIERAIRRAGAEREPAWLFSYCITGFSVSEARASISRVMREAADKCGGIHSVLVDGVADLVADVNDPGESNGFVSDTHALAIKYTCPIVGVIHYNPGSEKQRGHLGSQLERKAESNIKLERDGDAITLWADKNRRAPILKDHGPRFAWSEQHQMFVSVESAAGTREKAEFEMLKLEAEAVFTRAEKTSLRWGDFNALLAKEIRLSDSGARKRMEKMVRARVITRDVLKHYTLTQ